MKCLSAAAAFLAMPLAKSASALSIEVYPTSGGYCPGNPEATFTADPGACGFATNTTWRLGNYDYKPNVSWEFTPVTEVHMYQIEAGTINTTCSNGITGPTPIFESGPCNYCKARTPSPWGDQAITYYGSTCDGDTISMLGTCEEGCVSCNATRTYVANKCMDFAWEDFGETGITPTIGRHGMVGVFNWTVYDGITTCDEASKSPLYGYAGKEQVCGFCQDGEVTRCNDSSNFKFYESTTTAAPGATTASSTGSALSTSDGSVFNSTVPAVAAGAATPVASISMVGALLAALLL